MGEQDSLFPLFVAETKEHLELAEECLLKLGDTPQDDTIQSCFRAIHSIKGSAGFFELVRIHELSHASETLLDRLRSHELTVTSERIEALLQTVTLLNQEITALEQDTKAPSEGDSALLSRLGQLAELPSRTAEAPANEAMADTSFHDDFLVEASELLAGAEDALLVADPTAEHVQIVFRSFHTLKGISAYLGFPLIEQFAHHIESQLIGKAGEPIIRLMPEQRRTLMEAVDHIRILIKQEVPSSGGLKIQNASRLGEILVNQGIPRQVIESAAAQLRPGERLGDKLVAESGIPREMVESAAERQASLRASPDVFSRVAITKLEDLVNTVGELLITQSMVAETAIGLGIPKLISVIERQTRIMKELQALALNLRMVPLRSTFKKVARACHDTAYKVGKIAEFTMIGEDTEIDRTVAEGLADPLLHMIRNAVDHGIESSDARLAIGKSAKGLVKLSAEQSGDHVIITMQDDGRGLDHDAIRSKAIQRGLIQPDAKLGLQEIYQLIFLPGFSTAERVTGISGRGVGMDIVRRNVQDLKGSIDIISSLGRGTTFVIKLPLTTAIIDAMLLRVGSQRFLIPVGSVIEASQLSTNTVQTIMNRGRVIESRGQLMPVVNLGEVLELHEEHEDAAQAILVVVEHFNGRYALEVDEILGQQQAVIKPLTGGIPHHPGLAGSAILSDGRVGLILDPNRLLATYASVEMMT